MRLGNKSMWNLLNLTGFSELWPCMGFWHNNRENPFRGHPCSPLAKTSAVSMRSNRTESMRPLGKTFWLPMRSFRSAPKPAQVRTSILRQLPQHQFMRKLSKKCWDGNAISNSWKLNKGRFRNSRLFLSSGLCYRFVLVAFHPNSNSTALNPNPFAPQLYALNPKPDC